MFSIAWRISFLLCTITQILAQQECTVNFRTQEQIQDALNNVSVLETTNDDPAVLYVYPSINFTCDTTIVGWIMAGVDNSVNSTVYPEIHTWRLSPFTGLQYLLQNDTTDDIIPTKLGNSLYLYNLSSPILVLKGDVLGIVSRSGSKISPYFFNDTNDYFVDTIFDRIFLTISASTRGNGLFPLVVPLIQGEFTPINSSVNLPSSSILSLTMSVDMTSMSMTPTTSSRTTVTSVSPTTVFETITISTPLSMQRSSLSMTTLSITTITTTSISISSTTSTPIVVVMTFSDSVTPSESPPVITDRRNLPVAVIAGITIALVLILVIIGLAFVLVLLFAMDRKMKNKGEVASPPDNYATTSSPFDNPNYTPVINNVQLVSVQTNSSTLTNGDQFSSHYDVPEYSDPITSPTPILYENSSETKILNGGGIYSDEDHYELEPQSLNSQTALIDDHYEMGSSFDIPVDDQPCSVIDNTVNHYEMELSNSSGIYEQEYERPVSSRNNTIVREKKQLPLTNKYHHEQTSPSHDYSVLDGSIFVPNEEERVIMRQRSAVFDEQAYAQLGIIQKQKYENVVLFEKTDSYWKPSTQASLLYDQLSSRKYREIPRSHLHIIKHLGSGQFGTVNEGVWSVAQGKIPVAVKLISPSASEAEKVKLLQEGAIMGQFDHRNIVRLHGVVTVGEPVMIVIELMPKGDLRNYLKIVRQELTQSSSSVDVPHQLIKFCKEVAKGMNYLSDKSFVHRDLAARNVLLTEDLVCKIGDFGMSRDLDDENYYVSHGGKIPVKWTAPEALQFKKYSPLSDIWSYGAVMYEIWSLAHKPFEGVSNPQTIDLVQSGYRLPPPPGCPRSMYQLMIHCWHPDSSRRPKFSSIIESLSEEPKRLLSWRDIDIAVHLQASVLGAALEAGQDLYPELQQTFIRSTIKIK